MSRSRSRRRSAALLLAAALLSVTLDAAHARDLVRPSGGAIRIPVVAKFLAPFWDALLRLATKAGSGLDPKDAPAPEEGRQGLDPDGASTPSDAGGGLDPDGRT